MLQFTLFTAHITPNSLLMYHPGIKNWSGVKVSVVNLCNVKGWEVGVKEYEEIRFLLRQEKVKVCKVLNTSEDHLLYMVMALFIFHFSLSPYPLLVIFIILLI
jgi:hypothetical protein